MDRVMTMYLGIDRGRVSMPCWVSSVWLESILFRHRNELVWNVSRITSDLGEVSSDNFDRNILDMILLPSSVFSRYEGKLYYKAVRNGTSSHQCKSYKTSFFFKESKIVIIHCSAFPNLVKNWWLWPTEMAELFCMIHCRVKHHAHARAYQLKINHFEMFHFFCQEEKSKKRETWWVWPCTTCNSRNCGWRWGDYLSLPQTGTEGSLDSGGRLWDSSFSLLGQLPHVSFVQFLSFSPWLPS